MIEPDVERERPVGRGLEATGQTEEQEVQSRGPAGASLGTPVGLLAGREARGAAIRTAFTGESLS